MRRLVDRRTPGRLAYLLLSFPFGTVYFTFLVTGLSVGVGTAITLFGVPVLIGMVFAWRALARFERRLLDLTLGLELGDPYRPLKSGGAFGRLRERLADPATWKDLVYLFLAFPLGLLSFVVTITMSALVLGFLLAPVWYWSLPRGIELGALSVDSLPKALAVVPLGAVFAVLGLLSVRALAAMHTAAAPILLGSSPDPELSARVEDLEGSRARITAAADAERRRLERDLHDGAQQRLVAVSLVLGLASRASVPVEVQSVPEERLPEPVEAAAYFMVSEALTNVAKYARAGQATVNVSVGDGVATVEVADDGAGGADPRSGSGLRGLADRVGAHDGTLQLDSPPGVGTRLLARIPVGASSNGAATAHPPGAWTPVSPTRTSP